MGLFSTSVPTAKYHQIGDTCSGVIVAIDQQQRTEFTRDGTIGEPMYWSGGRPVAGAAVDPRSSEPNQPVMDHVVTVDTQVPDENGETEKRIFVKGKAELASIKAACISAGVRDIEIGGLLAKTWVSGAGGTADPRVYEYSYQPPADDNPASIAIKEAIARTARAHASSPVLKRFGGESNAGFQQQIPF